MTLLVLNAGSSSVKFAVWRGRVILIRGYIEQVGARARLVMGRQTRYVTAPTPVTAVGVIASMLAKQSIQPDVIAHRIVHGGDRFIQPTKLTASVQRRLVQLRHLAPLHLPANLAIVTAAAKHWPQSQPWGVFDTSLYTALPLAARLYALPPSVTKKFGIRKYGFHGISHAWAFHQAGKKFRPQKLRQAITIHLGAGDSMTLWKNGRPADTSMGFTPLEGLTMTTRSGDLDPMIPLYLQTHGGFSIRQVTTMLNRQSGLYGLTGLHDVRDVLEAAGHRVPGWTHRHYSATTRHKAKLALEVFRYDIQRYLGSYIGLSTGLQAIIFTGSVGQNATVRRLIIHGLHIPPGVRRIVVPADEETAIAEAVRRVIH